MITTRRTRVWAVAAAILILFTPPASAQLLQKLTTQATPVVGSITCAPVQSSPKIEDGIRTWLQRGGTYDVPMSPGNAQSAVTIASFSTSDTLNRDDDRISIFSSRGPTWHDGFAKPDVAAPGQSLVSVSDSNATLFQQYPNARVGASYLRLSGTSMATAVASGVAALFVEAHRTNSVGAAEFAPNTVKAIVEHTSLGLRDDAGAEYDALTQGSGGLNAAGAIDFAGAIDSRLPLGSYWMSRVVMPATMIAGRATLWSQCVLWGGRPLSGAVLEQRQTAWLISSRWGQTLLWSGDSTLGQHVVWGTSDPVWGSHIVWGTGYTGSTDGQHIVWGTTGGPDATVWGNVAPVADGKGSPPDGN